LCKLDELWVLLCGNRGPASGSRHDLKAVQTEGVVSSVNFVYTLLVAKSGAPLQVRESIVACELFGISENNVRGTLAHLTIEALLEGAGRGSYLLGPQVKEISAQLFARRSADQHLRPWNGSYQLVACNDLSRSDRNILHQPERALHMLGFVEQGKDLYVHPNNIEPDISSLHRRLIEFGLEPTALVYQAMEFEDTQTQQMQNLWSGELLNDSYRRNCEKLESGGLRAELLRLEVAARETFILGRDAIRQIVFNPLLPPPLVDVVLRTEFFTCTQRFVDHVHQIWRTFLQQSLRVNCPITQSSYRPLMSRIDMHNKTKISDALTPDEVKSFSEHSDAWGAWAVSSTRGVLALTFWVWPGPEKSCRGGDSALP